MTSITDNQGTSTRPYLLRALHDWCTDNGFTPYIAVHVDESVQVPREHVKNNEIVLNVGFEATSGLKLGNEAVEFRARFGGVSRDIVVPVDHVVAIYARENGQGMAFPVPTTDGVRGPVGVPASAGPASAAASAPAAGAPTAPLRTLRLASVADDAPAAPARGAQGDGPALRPNPGTGSEASSDAKADAKADAQANAQPGAQPNAHPSADANSAPSSVPPSPAKAQKKPTPETPPPDGPAGAPPRGPRPALKRIK